MTRPTPAFDRSQLKTIDLVLEKETKLSSFYASILHTILG